MMAGPVETLDKFVLKQYTRFSLFIPDSILYKATSSLQMAGFLGIASIFRYSPDVSCAYSTGVSLGLMNLPDAYLNIKGLRGELEDCLEGTTELSVQINKMSMRMFRPYVFMITSMFGTLGAYGLWRYLVGDELNPLTVPSIQASLSFFCISSSMYMKDRDPKLLEKKRVLVPVADAA
jgi:hypothetical protein